MSVELEIEQASFYRLLESLFREQGVEDPLSRFRAKGWELFQSLGLPTRKSEVFQYVPLRRLFGKTFELQELCRVERSEIAPYILPECKRSVAVFVNGQLDLELSCFEALPAGALAIPLDEALRGFGSFISRQMAKFLEEELDPFAALNAAFMKKGLFLYVPPKAIFEAPLHLLQVVKGASGFSNPHVQAFFGAHVEACLVETRAFLEGSETFQNGISLFSLEEGAKISYHRISLNAPATHWSFDAFRAALKRDSSLKTVAVEIGGAASRGDYKVSLIGENAEATLNGLAMLREKRQVHTHVRVDHKAEGCRSLQLFKAALDDFSRASFEGKIYVERSAQKTQAFQLNNNLLLSDNAQADSKPNLEIFADDVKASHGATVGQLDQDHLFYLSTRGLAEGEAKNLLVQGFCKEVIDLIEPNSLLAEGLRAVGAYKPLAVEGS